jgi:pilus assembly protein CpaF
VNETVVTFLEACVKAKRNMIVSGGTSSGKTTVLNLLTEFIPDDERIVTAEVTAELRLHHPHVIGLEARPADGDGKGEVTIADLITNAQRMRPDRIISGEVQGGEAWDMLKVMTNGYDGSMFSIHATNTQDVIERLEIMSTQATNLPLLQIRAKIAQAIDVITQQNLLHPSGRRIVSITEVVGLKNNVVETQDIFRYEQTGNVDGRAVGEFHLTGYVPSFADRLDLPDGFFKA